MFGWGLANLLFALIFGSCENTEANTWLIVTGANLIFYSFLLTLTNIRANCAKVKDKDTIMSVGLCFELLCLLFVLAWQIYGVVLKNETDCEFLDLSK